MEKEIISKDVFDKETEICRRMGKEKGSCAWGKCDSCGVVPLLHKLHKGELLEDKAEIEEAKNRVFGR